MNHNAGEHTHNAEQSNVPEHEQYPYADEGKYDANGLPVIVFKTRQHRERQQPTKPGLTRKLRAMEVQDIIELGDHNRNSVYTLAKQIGITVVTTTGGDGKIYIRRES